MSEERIEEPQSTLQWVLGLAAQGQVLTPLPKDWRVAYTALASLRSRLSQAEVVVEAARKMHEDGWPCRSMSEAADDWFNVMAAAFSTYDNLAPPDPGEAHPKCEICGSTNALTDGKRWLCQRHITNPDRI